MSCIDLVDSVRIKYKHDTLDKTLVTVNSNWKNNKAINDYIAYTLSNIDYSTHDVEIKILQRENIGTVD